MGAGEAAEKMLAEALVPQPADEALNKAVLHRLARRDVMPFDLAVPAPGEDRMRGQVGAIVTDHHARPASLLADAIKLPGHPLAGQGGVDYGRQAFPAEVVNHAQDAKSRATRANWVPAAPLRRFAFEPSAAPRDNAGTASCGSARSPPSSASHAGTDSRSAGVHRPTA